MIPNKIPLQSILANSSNLLTPSYHDIVNTIGLGSKGKVLHISLPNEGDFALKIIKLKANDKENLLNELNEIYLNYQLLKQARPNILKSYLYFFDERSNEFSFTMSLMKGGDLLSQIKRNGSMSFELFFDIFQGVVSGYFF